MKTNKEKKLRNARLYFDRVFNHLTFAQLAKKYNVCPTTAYELFLKSKKKYAHLSERKLKNLINKK
jgi:hypothetical protein